MTKKRLITLMTVTAALALALTCAACSSGATSGNAKPAGGAATTECSTDSIIAAHEGRGTDITSLTEVSIEGCTANGCHGGSWKALSEKNEDMWTGVGQIGAANPHAAHASAAYECADCHSLTETSVNQCNGCHIFESPEGWVDKEKTTATYGPTNDEPIF